DMVLAGAVSPDGKWIVSGNADWTLKLWDAETGRELRSLEGHTDAVWALAVSPDGKWIVSGGLDKTLKVWNAETGALADSIRVDGGPRGVAWHGSSIWVGCANTTICRYEHQP
ncbi:MAG: hypothetical protein HY720_03285, partial [Planctomycetes bacterium]|nr:hypothetical protein [Planctomycetota bacterium]